MKETLAAGQKTWLRLCGGGSRTREIKYAKEKKGLERERRESLAQDGYMMVLCKLDKTAT